MKVYTPFIFLAAPHGMGYTASSRQQAADSSEQTTDRQKTADSREQTVDSRERTADRQKTAVDLL
jgi:hypothetical protein